MSVKDERTSEEIGAGQIAGQRVLPTPSERPPGRLAPGFDLEEETSTAVAPIGPTELHTRVGPPEAFDEAAASSRGGHAPDSPEELARQIQELEARLDRMMHGREESRSAAAGPAAAPARPEPAPAPAAATATAQTPPGEVRDRAASDKAGGEPEILATDFYQRQWGQAGMRRRAEEVDEFGFDPAYEERYRPLFDFLYRSYFRVEVEGAAGIPADGRCLVVCNHSGGPIPYDGIMLRTAVRHEHPQRRELRWLAEDFVYYLPFAGTAMNRLGAVRACQENAERLLSAGKLVAVFPEGVKGIGKLYRDRYKLQRFGRGGFIRLCLRTRTPLVPCAIVGAEESNPLLHRVEHLARVLKIPYVPITPTFPALGPLGLIPAPTKWKMRFGEMVRFDAYGPEAAEDEILVGRLAERVRASIQSLIDKTLAERRSIWFG